MYSRIYAVMYPTDLCWPRSSLTLSHNLPPPLMATSSSLVRICNELKCDVSDIMEFVSDESGESGDIAES